MKKVKAPFFLFLSIVSFSTGQVFFVDSLNGFQLYLPVNWTSEITDSLGVNFRDTTLDTSISQAYLGVILFHLTPAEKLNPEEWVREQYIAIKGEIDSAQEYLSVMLFTDSSHTMQIDGRWGPDICAFFYDNLENLNFIEYVTYTHANDYGYELFAFGDSLTMTQNFSIYMGMLRSIKFILPKIAAIKRPEGTQPLQFSHKDLKHVFYGMSYDIRGRVRPLGRILHNNPYIVILSKPGKKLLIQP